MWDYKRIKKNKMAKRSKDLKNICSEEIFSKRSEQLLAMMQETFELELIRKDIMNDFKKVIKLLDALKPATPNNKHKQSVQSAVVNTNQKEVRPSCSNNHKHRRESDVSISSMDSINDSVLITNKYQKVLVFDEARALSKTDHHSNNPDKNRKRRALSNTTEHSDKSDTSDIKKARTLSTATEYSDISGSLSNNKILVFSKTNDHSNKYKSPTTKKVLTLSNIHDHADKSGSQSNEGALVLSNTNDHSNRSDSLSKKLVGTSSNTTDHYDKSAGQNKKLAVASSNTTDSDKFAGPSKKKAVALSRMRDHNNKSVGPRKKMALASSNTTDHSDKSAGPRKKMAPAPSNATDHSDKSAGQSKKKAVASSNTTDQSDKSVGLRKKMALESSNSTDHSEKPTVLCKKKAVTSSNTTDHSNESDESTDKENHPENNTSQSNERIPTPVAVPVAQEEHREDDFVPIGSGRTLVRREKYKMVNWKSCNTATRSLLRAVFSRAILSTHSLSGKQSPAFPDRPAKMCLDQQKISDIIIAVTERFKVNKNVIRGIITTKCADESKMMKTRQMKQEENE